MSTQPWHPRAREALADLLADAGPDAGTLCAGWQTRHLAAHLVLRESSWRAVGIGVPPLHGLADRAIERTAAEAEDPAAYAALVERFRMGPPRWSPFGLAGDGAQLVEFVVHAEDVRRGADLLPGGRPGVREDWPVELEARLWQMLTSRARLLYRQGDGGLVLVVPDGPRHVVRRPPPGEASVVLQGQPVDLLLQGMGRGSAAEIDATGPPQRLAELGLCARPADGPGE